MKEIFLNRGKKTIVNDEDFEYLKNRKWYVNNFGYVVGNQRVNGKNKTIRMQRIIMKVDDPKVEVDHINLDKLDNRKENLRICTHIQNTRNVKIRKHNTSGFKGVFWNKERDRWMAYIRIDCRHKFIGYFREAREAAEAYNLAATKYFGNFARLNNI